MRKLLAVLLLAGCTDFTAPAQYYPFIDYDSNFDRCPLGNALCVIAISGHTTPGAQIWTFTADDPAHFVTTSGTDGAFSGDAQMQFVSNAGGMIICATSKEPRRSETHNCMREMAIVGPG